MAIDEEGNRMGATTEIRPTKIEFENEKEYQKFVNYAESKERSKSNSASRLRAAYKKHQDRDSKK